MDIGTEAKTGAGLVVDAAASSAAGAVGMAAAEAALSLLPFQDWEIAFSFFMEGAEASDFQVVQFGVDEALFGVARIEVRLVSRRGDIDLDALIDRPATLTLHHRHLSHLRHFSGIVVEAESGDSGHRRTFYRLVLMPSLERLDHGSDCRIFQGQSVPEIVDVVLKEHGIEDVEWRLGEEHAPREYLVCYRETHLAFIERILAEEGIFYYFRHGEGGQCTFILSDNPDDLLDCPGQSHLEYHGLASTVHEGVYCSSCKRLRRLRSTSYRQRDYSFKHPTYAQEHLSGCAAVGGSAGNGSGTGDEAGGEQGDYALYDYPGRYKVSAVGEVFTRHKWQALRVGSDVVHGRADTPLLSSGHGFELTHHPDSSFNRRWRLLSVRHEGVQPQALGEDGQGEAQGSAMPVVPVLKGEGRVGSAYGIVGAALIKGQTLLAELGALPDDKDGSCRYGCAFVAQDADAPYRPPQLAKPLVDGPQIAHVVGPEGEEIHTDEYGRVKVHFPWDRHKAPDAENSSCWIRVASNWAGAKWGHIAIPRIGQEVIVEFLEGDPDQPIITGRTYHATNQPPYKLPDHKTKMVIRSDTHKHGDDKIGFNELSFEDDKGREEVYLRAQKNMSVEVLNDRREQVNRDQFQHIIRDTVSHIGGDEEHVVSGNVSIAVGDNKLSQYLLSRTNVLFGKLGSLAKYLRIPDPFNLGKGNYQLFVEKNKSEIVNAGSSEVVGIAKSTIVGNIQQTTVGKKKSLIVRGRYDADIGRVHNLNVGRQYNINVGPHIEITMNKEGELHFKAKKIKFSAEKLDMN